MKKSKHTEEQIIGVLKQVEAGRTVKEVARELGVSTYTIYAWKAKYGGMDVSQAQEARQLREENARLKKLVADPSLDKDALQAVIRKNVWSAAPFARGKSIPEEVCVNVSGLFWGCALATMSIRTCSAS
jgi:putative transposase